MVQGFPPTMPSFQGKLAAPEVAAIVEFIKSLRTGVEDRPQEGPAYEPVRAR
jgi:cytochrome c oxidase subunit 2